METLKFKTTIKCSGCVANATPYLDEVAGKNNWKVDVQNPDKILTIIAEKDIPEQQIVSAVNKAGYKAERISE